MEKVIPDLPWGKIAAVAAALVAIHLVIRGASALGSMASRQARYRLGSGHLARRS